MKLIQIFIVLFSFYSCSESEEASIEPRIYCVEEAGISICTDTLELNIKGFISNSILFKENYYLFMLDPKDRDKMGNENPVKFYQVSKNGLSIKQLNYPKELEQSFYCETQIRNDSLIVSSQFDNESYYLNDRTLKWTKVADARIPIYDDADYRVTHKCNGEFGGIVSFYDKQQDVYYDALSTCAVVVNRLNNKFYVTNYLGHMGSHSEILEITDPRELYKRTVIPDSKTGFHHSELSKGYKKLFDSWDVTIHTSFVSNNHLYHIYTENDSSYVGRLVDGNLTKDYQTDFYPNYEHHMNMNNQFLRFYSKFQFKLNEPFLFGVMEIIDGNLRLHYIQTK